MDKKLYNIFSEKTEVPENVTNRVEETLNRICLESQAAENTKIRSFSRKKWKRSLAFSMAAAVTLCGTVFAAEKYIGISQFFEQSGRTLPEGAEDMIAEAPVQEEDGESIISYTVREALCDKNSVQIVIEAAAKEKGKYLLVGEYLMDEDPVSSLGMEGEQTIGEYAKEKGLTIVRVGASFKFDSDLGITNAMEICTSEGDDVLAIYSSARKEDTSENLTVSCMGTAALPDASTVDDIMRTNISFKLEDKSQTRTVSYGENEKDGGILTADGRVKIQSVAVEETELAEYVTIEYVRLEEGNISLDVTDENGNVWKISELGGFSEDLETGEVSVEKITYEKTELPEKIGVRVLDHDTGTAYEPVFLEIQQ